VETQDARAGHGDGNRSDDASRRASLKLELRVPDKRMLATFRDAFLRWLNDRTGPFGRAIGLGDRLSIDELPPEADSHGMSTLRLSVTWSVAKFTPREPPLALRSFAASEDVVADGKSDDQFVFVPCPALPDAPLNPEVPPAAASEEKVPPPPMRSPQPARARATAASIGTSIAAAVSAAQRSLQDLQEAMRWLRPESLTEHVPMLATHRREWTIGLLASAVVAAGFVVGSLYLGRPGARGRDLASSPPHEAAIAARSTQAVTPREPPVAKAGRTTREAEASPMTQKTAQPARVAASGTNAIADSEVVTSAPVRETRVARVTNAGPSVDVVRAVDKDSMSASSKATASKVKGTLLVKSDPQGAEVSINGVVQGRTPLMIRDLGAGSRVVRLELRGYERWSWAVSVVANKRTPVNVKLRPESRGLNNPH
jgi:hypothetical protein